MLELPEVLTISEQLKKTAAGRTVKAVLPPSKEHKFCWFQGKPSEYEVFIKGAEIVSAQGFGIYVEIEFSNGCRLCFNDGIHVRLMESQKAPKLYQMKLVFEDDEALIFTVSMYGSIILHQGEYDNEYYRKSKAFISPFSDEFPAYYRKMLAEIKPSVSAKAFLATDQRFPGIGNGVLQDILLTARIHPRRKIGTLGEREKEGLGEAIISVLRNMTESGGRNTEKDLLGRPGGYQVMLSKHTLSGNCPFCNGSLIKETYLGGSVYFCPCCQSLTS